MLRKLLYRVRIALKTLAARHRTVIEFCDDCGVRQPVVWSADNALWAKVIGKTWDGSSEGPGGVLCPRCFDSRARRLGLGVRFTAAVEYEFVPR
jgi:hypothetical protein